MTHLSELIQQKQGELSNRALARQSGLSEIGIRLIKKGERIPKPETLEKLAHALAISLQELQNARDKDRGITRRGFLELAAVTAGAGFAGALRPPQEQEDVESQTPGDYEAQAKMARAAGNWPKAESLWILTAGIEDQEGNVPKWADALLQASQMAVNLSKFDNAMGALETVIRRSGVSATTKVEALIRLGWAYFGEEKYSQAKAVLSHGVHSAETLLSERKEDLSIENLLGMGCHFLGRTMTTLGEQTNDKDALETALYYLNWSYTLGKKYGDNPGLYPRPHPLYQQAFTAVGFDLLRHVPIFLHLEDESQANNSLAGAEEYLTEDGIMGGHLNYHRALLRMEELSLKTGQRSPKPQELLDRAAEGFTAPMFYPKGLANVYREKGCLLHDSTTWRDVDALKRAFEYVLVASILHPYEKNLGEMEVIAEKADDRLGRQLFLTFTRDLTADVRNMEREPFSALKQYDPDRNIWAVERSLEKINEAVKRGLGLNEPLFPPIADNLFDFIPI
jgi:transcriptional regulator with XRE-family HTH domain